MLNIGEKVYISKSSIYYNSESSKLSNNPPDIEGTIIKIYSIGDLPYRVLWSNGSTNSYDIEDLESKNYEEVLEC